MGQPMFLTGVTFESDVIVNGQLVKAGTKVTFATPSETMTISAQGSPVRLYGAAGVLGPLAFLRCHVDPDLPDDIVELRDGYGRVLGKIINVGRE